jgi:hypothetical protein
MKKYNLWIFNHYSGNLKQGMEYRHFFLARHLAKLGHRVSIIASTYSHLFSSPPKTKGLVTYEKIDGVEFVWLKSPKYKINGAKRLLNMLSYSVLAQVTDLEKRLGSPDAVMGSSPHPFALMNTLSLSKRFNAVSLVEIRDLWPLMLVELGSMKASHPLARVFQAIENKAFKKADRVISLWHSADDYMLQNGVSKDRYRYLPNGIELDDSVFSGEHSLLIALDEAKTEGKFIVGYGGSHGHANPLDQVIDACLDLKNRGVTDVIFFMVGDGPDKEKAVARALELSLTNLIWHDSVSKDVIMAVYKKLDVAFIGLRDLPLFKYGPTPNKLMDYLAAGKPIIYAINSSFDPVKEHDLGISIRPEDGAALADSIVTMSRLDGSTLSEMGMRSRGYAEISHSYKELANQLDRIIEEIL